MVCLLAVPEPPTLEVADLGWWALAGVFPGGPTDPPV
jgi:hypothetical protein